MKTDAQLQQTQHHTITLDSPPTGRHGPSDQLQQCALARTVIAYHPQGPAVRQFKADIPQRHEIAVTPLSKQ